MLGRYQVLAHLATGGMAEIYLARATGLEGFERFVVVKCIKPEHARDQRFVGMFIDEARLSAQLHHTNIAQVYDIGQEGGAYYFAMEYVHGENVRELLHKVALQRAMVPLEHALTIIGGAAAGLHYAHEKRGNDRRPLNIVHRDVSPSNVIVAFDGAVKVVDFGIAKAAARMTETRSGTLKGKIAYMSPEQCTGRPIDRRSDVFALGIVLYELTTVTRLFKGESDYVTMNKIVTGDIEPPSARRADYPRELEKIVLKALASDPEDRQASVAVFLDEILAFSQREKITTSTLGLERYLRELFGDKPEPWLDPLSASSDGIAVEEILLLPAGSGSAGGGIPLGHTATATRSPEASGVTATPGLGAYAPATGPGSQGSLLLSAEIKSMPEARPRRAALWLGSALLAGAALIGGAVVYDVRKNKDGPPEELPASREQGAGEPAPAPDVNREPIAQPVVPAIDAGVPPVVDAGDGAAALTPVVEDRRKPPGKRTIGPRSTTTAPARGNPAPAPVVPDATRAPPVAPADATGTPRKRTDLTPPE